MLIAALLCALAFDGAAELSLDRSATRLVLTEALAAAPHAFESIEVVGVDFVEGTIEGELDVTLLAGTAAQRWAFVAHPELDRRYGRWGLRLEHASGKSLRVELPDRLAWRLGQGRELTPRLQRLRIEEDRVVLELAWPATSAAR